MAKAQLGLDTDELADAQRDLDRASGDQSAQIQEELAAHEASMRQYDSQSHSDGQVAVISAQQRGTLAKRLEGWFSQRDRYQSLQQAMQQSQQDVQRLTAEHNAQRPRLMQKPALHPAMRLTVQSGLRISKTGALSGKYSASMTTESRRNNSLLRSTASGPPELLLQHRIVLHMIHQSLSLIVLILICMLIGDPETVATADG